MFLHIGDKDIISDKNIVGVFNVKTLEKSEKNTDYLDEIKEDTRSIIIDTHDEVIVSKISSFTLIERFSLPKKDCFWIKDGDII